MEQSVILYSPHPKQLEVHRNNTRFRVLNWGRQTGKSMMAINEALMRALQEQGRYFIVAPTYRQAKDIYWKQYLAMLPKELIEHVNNNDLTITIKYLEDPKLGIKHDPNLPPSTIELKGMDNADLLRGMRANGIIFDEFAFAEDGMAKWDLVFRPMLGVSEGWAMFISTPNGFNHFYDMANAGQDPEKPNWWYSHATPYDNPYFSDQEIELIKREKSEDNFYQEYMAEFRKMEGLVYKSFDRVTHVVDPSAVPVVGTNLVGIDFGYTNPFACVFVRIDYDENWWVYDEIYKREMIADQAVQILLDKTTGDRITAYVGDAQSAESIATFNQRGIPVMPGKKGKDSVKNGIVLIQEKLKLREQFSGRPKPRLFVASNCINFIEEIERYAYPKGTDSRNPKEDPQKKDDHLMDALRYLAITWQQGTIQEFAFPTNDLPEYV